MPNCQDSAPRRTQHRGRVRVRHEREVRDDTVAWDQAVSSSERGRGDAQPSTWASALGRLCSWATGCHTGRKKEGRLAAGPGGENSRAGLPRPSAHLPRKKRRRGKWAAAGLLALQGGRLREERFFIIFRIFNAIFKEDFESCSILNQSHTIKNICSSLRAQNSS